MRNSRTSEVPPSESAAAGESTRGPRRRDVLVGAAGIGIGAAAMFAGGAAVQSVSGPATFGNETATSAANHQWRIHPEPPAHAVFIAVDLDQSVDRARLESLLRILTDDANRLMAGYAPVGDQEPQLAETPAGLTITLGFGPRLVDLVNPRAKPEWLAPLPAFKIDQLQDAWSGGDLLVHVASDDRLTLAHAQRTMLKDLRAYTTVRWQQDGFRNSRGTLKPGTTQRNLFGQVDGTVNPAPGSADFDELVWIGANGTTGVGGASPDWLAGGTSFVLRRIQMNLETWDLVDTPGRDAAIGRRIDTGAPLTGSHEHDEPDFEALTPQGFTVINPVSHMRRARSEDPTERIHRLTYNYDLPVAGVGGMGASVSDSGLIFGSLQANPLTQFVPIQQRLSDADLLNEWTVPIGSAVFAIPPAASGGGFIGDSLYAA
ncbi:Dyp-type peroxidase [Gulosibacter molinativorax]|uniref:Peroxidase n=1 Tax=Gulosibacter molinativorax TaxID=256821 RepID=A0ABT7C8N6_9MICO|nr:Dyp-type peroxidase [Gulosibacter molinativorax]MDJ1371503.1 peroxidase [Gulosibacter molinativorax]QUY62445.1 Putative deferrochelatase/peroxidase EfeN [Gulosibacter molinativorax]